MIECVDLNIHYGKTLAVEQLNMTINQGEAVTVVGESGCGKTSLLHAIAGIIQPSKGRVLVKGQEVEGIGHGTAIILQADGLFPWKTVEDNVMMALLKFKLPSRQARALSRQALDDLGIAQLGHKYLHQISGGQRQRVAIARSLVQEPEVLLMDEPTGALDMITKEKFQDSLHKLFDGRQITSVMVTHDIEEAVNLGMKIVVMKEGRLLQIIDNPLYGMADLRSDLGFYELCLQVRQVMKA